MIKIQVEISVQKNYIYYEFQPQFVTVLTYNAVVGKQPPNNTQT